MAGSDDLRRLSGGGGLLLAATLVGNALLLGLDVAVNGALGQADYGWWCALRRMLALAGFVGSLGLENIVIREVAGARGDTARAGAAVRGAMVAAVGASTLLALGLAAAGSWLRAEMDGPPGGEVEIALAAATLPLASLRLVAVSASQGAGRIAPRALVMFVAWPVLQLALLPALLWGMDGPARLAALGSYAAAMAVGAGLGVALLARSSRAILVGPGGVRAPAALLAASWPLWLQGMVMAGYTWLDQLLLAGLAGPVEAGRYGPVAALAPLYGLGLTSLNGMFAPMIAEKHATNDLAGLARLYRTVTRWAVALSVPPLAVSLAVPGVILAIWPNGDAAAMTALRITALAWLGCTVAGSVNYLLIMAGHQRQTLWNGVPAVILSVVLSLLLVPTLGVTGAALANAGAVLTANGIGLWQVWRALGLHPFHAALGRPLLAAIPATLAAALPLLVPLPALVAAGLSGILATAAFAVTMRALPLDDDDRMVLGALARRFKR